VFVLEQDTYEREGLDWTVISFKDNQGVIDLISKRPTGTFVCTHFFSNTMYELVECSCKHIKTCSSYIRLPCTVVHIGISINIKSHIVVCYIDDCSVLQEVVLPNSLVKQ
jgi:Myosin head (motor domain)